MRKLILMLLLITSAALQAQDDDADLGSSHQLTPEPNEETHANEDSLLEAQKVEPAPEKSKVATPIVPPRAPGSTHLNEGNTEAVEARTPAAAANPPVKSTESGFLSGRRRPGATFGFGLSQPTTFGKYNHYEYLYGKKRRFVNFYAGYYLGSYLFDLGLVGRLGYFTAEGRPIADRKGFGTLPMKGDLTSEAKSDTQKIGLTLIPTQVALEMGLSPFKTRWLVLRGWLGWEELYVQETLEPNLPAAATDSSQTTYASTGWNEGLVTGFMVSLSLSGIEPRADYSLRSMGIDRVYVSPFFELVKTTRAKMGNFDRKSYGIAFSFEGLR